MDATVSRDGDTAKMTKRANVVGRVSSVLRDRVDLPQPGPDEGKSAEFADGRRCRKL